MTDQFQDFLETATKTVAAVRDNPEGRIDLRREFYKKYGEAIEEEEEDDDGTTIADAAGDDAIKDVDDELDLEDYGLGGSEIAFFEWEIRRGVLNPLTAEQPGSAWWRAVNEQFLINSQTAMLIFEANASLSDVPNAIKYWLDYLKKPTPVAWYRAHNASITEAYFQFTDLAKKESKYEQLFLNEVLSRVLYAQAMVEDDTFLHKLGKISADPRLPAVQLLVSRPAFYPQHYPLNEQDKSHVMHQGTTKEDMAANLLDNWFIGIRIKTLYEHAAKWLNIPQIPSLLDYAHDPIYPNQETSA